MSRKKNKGVTMSLADFGGGVSPDEMRRASAPRSRPGDEGYGERGYRGGRGRDNWGGGGGFGYNDRGPVSDNQDNWRKGGSGGGGGGFGGGGGRDYGGRGGSGYGNGGYGDRRGGDDWRRGGDSRRGDDGYGDRRSGDVRAMGRGFDGDDRPAHLRRFGRRNDGKSSEEGRADDRDGEEKEGGVPEDETPQREVLLDESLVSATVVKASEMRTELDKALVNKTSVSMKQLKKGLGKIDVEDQIEELSVTLGKMLLEDRAKFSALSALLDQRSVEPRRELLEKAVKTVKLLAPEPEDALQKLGEGEEGKVVLSTLAAGKEGEALEEYLKEADLFELFPKPDLSADVEAALQRGDKPSAVLASIESKLKPEQSAAELLPVVASFALKLVFGEGKVNASALDSFKGLFKRCISGDSANMAQLVFLVQDAWFHAGKDKAVIRPLFEHLHSTGLVTPAGFIAWKEDRTNKAKGKPQALLKVNAWVKEIQPVIEEESDEESESSGSDSEDDEGED